MRVQDLLCVFLCSYLCWTGYYFLHLPPIKENHPYVILDSIWNATELEQLRTMWQDFNLYQTVKEDATSSIPHIGEMTDPDLDSCPHQYLILRQISNQTKCVLPDRVDVAHHHFKTGGIAGRKETFDQMIGRLLAFNKILHRDALTIPEMRSLFASPKYLQAVETICPGRPVLDPIQLGIIILVPGQEVAVHYDVPWFTGATRYDFPQWLLVAMHRSGLFAEYFIPQIQGVAYIHGWNLTGGSFVFWDRGIQHSPKDIPAIPNTGIVLDGSLVAHGVSPFGKLETPSLAMIPHHRHQLRRNIATDRWFVQDTDADRVFPIEYTPDEFRVSLVWRSRCFRDQAELEAWHQAPKMELTTVLDILKLDLQEKGLLKDPNISPIDLALLMIETYIDYPPSPVAIIPWNYCMLGKNSEFLTRILSPFC